MESLRRDKITPNVRINRLVSWKFDDSKSGAYFLDLEKTNYYVDDMDLEKTYTGYIVGYGIQKDVDIMLLEYNEDKERCEAKMRKRDDLCLLCLLFEDGVDNGELKKIELSLFMRSIVRNVLAKEGINGLDEVIRTRKKIKVYKNELYRKVLAPNKVFLKDEAKVTNVEHRYYCNSVICRFKREGCYKSSMAIYNMDFI